MSTIHPRICCSCLHQWLHSGPKQTDGVGPEEGLSIILGKKYISYETALATLNQDRLFNRRQQLSFNLAIKWSSSAAPPRNFTVPFLTLPVN